jgi:hypothetical protein
MSHDASLVQRARARDGNAFRIITKEVTNDTGSFDFSHKT